MAELERQIRATQPAKEAYQIPALRIPPNFDRMRGTGGIMSGGLYQGSLLLDDSTLVKAEVRLQKYNGKPGFAHSKTAAVVAVTLDVQDPLGNPVVGIRRKLFLPYESGIPQVAQAAGDIYAENTRSPARWAIAGAIKALSQETPEGSDPHYASTQELKSESGTQQQESYRYLLGGGIESPPQIRESGRAGNSSQPIYYKGEITWGDNRLHTDLKVMRVDKRALPSAAVVDVEVDLRAPWRDRYVSTLTDQMKFYLPYNSQDPTIARIAAEASRGESGPAAQWALVRSLRAFTTSPEEDTARDISTITAVTVQPENGLNTKDALATATPLILDEAFSDTGPSAFDATVLDSTLTVAGTPAAVTLDGEQCRPNKNSRSREAAGKRHPSFDSQAARIIEQSDNPDVLRRQIAVVEEHLRRLAIEDRSGQSQQRTAVSDDVKEALDVVSKIRIGNTVLTIKLRSAIEAELDDTGVPKVERNAEESETVFESSSLQLSTQPSQPSQRNDARTGHTSSVPETATKNGSKSAMEGQASVLSEEEQIRAAAVAIVCRTAQSVANRNGGILTYSAARREGLLTDEVIGLFPGGEAEALQKFGVRMPSDPAYRRGNGHSGGGVSRSTVRDYAETRTKASETGLANLDPNERRELLKQIREGHDDWALAAACKGTNTNKLYVEGAAQNKEKLICRPCPVRTECLAEALDNKIESGVWGGMTERERRKILRRSPDITSWHEILYRARDQFEAGT